MIKSLINKLMGRPGGLSCKETLDTLQSYLDGETDEQTARCMVEHLDAGRGCLGEAEMYHSISLDPPMT